MNTRFLLFFAILFLTGEINAQQIIYQPVVKAATFYNDGQLHDFITPERAAYIQQRKKQRTVNKGAAQTTRTYNYVDHLNIAEDADYRSSPRYVNLPYMWYSPDMFAIYDSTAGGIVGIRDSIRLSSYGMVFHPYWDGYKDGNYYNPGDQVISNSDNYTIDSVLFYGVYRRNKDKHTIVDTLRISYTYGFNGTSNIVAYYYLNPFAQRFNTDTLFSAVMEYDPLNHVIKKPATSGGPAVVTRTILLTEADTAREYFFVTPSLTVPADNLFGVTVTFRSGDTYTPYTDTAFVSELVNPANPYKFNMFRPAIYRHPNAFPTYSKYNYNSGQFLQLTDRPQPDEYGATWFWSTNPGARPSNYQFPDISFVVSCGTCLRLGTEDPSVVSIVGNPFPNPAKELITIPVSIKKTADITLSISDITGRQIAVNQYGSAPANTTRHFSFNIASWPSGIYFVAASANGSSVTKKFIIAR